MSMVVSSIPTILSVTPSIPHWFRAPGLPVNVSFLAGAYLGKGLLPVPEKLVQKIIRLEFGELMPETWLQEEEESSRHTITWPKHRSAPVTNILQ